MLTLRSISVLVLVALSGVAFAATQPVLQGRAQVVDGDTLVVADQKVRLFGRERSGPAGRGPPDACMILWRAGG
jgi:hypothetical protein